MSNYVFHRVVCSKQTLDTYFMDAFPFGERTPLEKPYISFNKLFDVRSLSEYEDKIGVPISYGFRFSLAERKDGLYVLKFVTRWEYPIEAIIRILELDHGVEWFAAEEGCFYVSKFYWDSGVKEDVLLIDDESYFEWRLANVKFEYALDDCDDSIWYFLQEDRGQWKTWESDDDFARYRGVAVYKIRPPF